jgi:hypothetical protein
LREDALEAVAQKPRLRFPIF